MSTTETAGRERRSATHVWRFASCEFDELRFELRVRGAAVEIETKPLDVLHQLLLHAGEVVTKDELLETVWPGTAVVDGSLATAVSKLRKALGTAQHAIVTVPRIGYRLTGPVQTTVRSGRPAVGRPSPDWDTTAGSEPSVPGVFQGKPVNATPTSRRGTSRDGGQTNLASRGDERFFAAALS